MKGSRVRGSRVTLIHWHAAEAAERAARLAAAGYVVATATPQGPPGLQALAVSPPDLFVIDLSRIPSHGQAVGIAIRQRAALRQVPLVFAGGEPEKVARVRKLLPDATYTEWPRIRSALRAAMRAGAPPAPKVPGTMSGYSGTPLPKKLGIGPESVVALLQAPDGFERTLGALPPGVRFVTALRGRADLILLFARSQRDLARRLDAAARSGRGRWDDVDRVAEEDLAPGGRPLGA